MQRNGPILMPSREGRLYSCVSVQPGLEWSYALFLCWKDSSPPTFVSVVTNTDTWTTLPCACGSSLFSGSFLQEIPREERGREEAREGEMKRVGKQPLLRSHLFVVSPRWNGATQRAYTLHIDQARKNKIQEKRTDPLHVQEDVGNNVQPQQGEVAPTPKELSFTVRSRSLVESRISGTLNSINLYTQGSHNRAVPLYASLAAYVLDAIGNPIIGLTYDDTHLENLKHVSKVSFVVTFIGFLRILFGLLSWILIAQYRCTHWRPSILILPTFRSRVWI